MKTVCNILLDGLFEQLVFGVLEDQSDILPQLSYLLFNASSKRPSVFEAVGDLTALRP